MKTLNDSLLDLSDCRWNDSETISINFPSAIQFSELTAKRDDSIIINFVNENFNLKITKVILPNGDFELKYHKIFEQVYLGNRYGSRYFESDESKYGEDSLISILRNYSDKVLKAETKLIIKEDIKQDSNRKFKYFLYKLFKKLKKIKFNVI
jgi:hypothetical protein